MKILVVGANGATGKWLVQHLLDRGHEVKVIVRSPEKLPEAVRRHERLTVVQSSPLDLSDAELREHVKGCTAVASCLGHNITFKGIFSPPRRLVKETVRRLCEAIEANHEATPTRFVLMNTVGNRNRDLDEPRSFGSRVVFGLLRTFLPPHADNEEAADYLRVQVGQQSKAIEWVAVRPDSLLDEEKVTEYEVHPSPTRSPLSNPGKTSRINVGHFMADLITDDAVWSKWKGKMPAIYNKGCA